MDVGMTMGMDMDTRAQKNMSKSMSKWMDQKFISLESLHPLWVCEWVTNGLDWRSGRQTYHVVP